MKSPRLNRWQRHGKNYIEKKQKLDRNSLQDGQLQWRVLIRPAFPPFFFKRTHEKSQQLEGQKNKKNNMISNSNQKKSQFFTSCRASSVLNKSLVRHAQITTALRTPKKDPNWETLSWKDKTVTGPEHWQLKELNTHTLILHFKTSIV